MKHKHRKGFEYHKVRLEYGVKVVMPSRFVTIFSSIVGVLTLGYYVPPWDFDVMARLSKRWNKQQRTKRNGK